MSKVREDVTFFVPTGEEKPPCPIVAASAVTGKHVKVMWRVILDYERGVEIVPDENDDDMEVVVWLSVYGPTLAESEKMPREAWRSREESLTAFATRILGPRPDLPDEFKR